MRRAVLPPGSELWGNRSGSCRGWHARAGRIGGSKTRGGTAGESNVQSNGLHEPTKRLTGADRLAAHSGACVAGPAGGELGVERRPRAAELHVAGTARQVHRGQSHLAGRQTGRGGIEGEEITAYLRPNPDMTAALDQLDPFSWNPYRPLGYTFPLLSFSYLHERQGKRELRRDSA